MEIREDMYTLEKFIRYVTAQNRCRSFPNKRSLSFIVEGKTLYKRLQ